MKTFSMKDLETIYSKVIGYTIKLIKNNKDLSKYKDIFDCIKHTNYDNFIQLIKDYFNFNDNETFKGVVWSNANGNIKTDGFSIESGDCDFVMLLQSGPYMRCFYDEIYKTFGDIIDDEIDDVVYNKLALFELCIRMHVSKECGNSKDDRLEIVIDKLCTLHNFNEKERQLLHKGRQFLNKIKHGRPFNTIDISQFNEAYDFMCENNITIFL